MRWSMSLYGRWLVCLRTIMLLVVVFGCNFASSAIVDPRTGRTVTDVSRLDPSFGQESLALPSLGGGGALPDGSGLYPYYPTGRTPSVLPLRSSYGNFPAKPSTDRVGLIKRPSYDVTPAGRTPVARRPVTWGAPSSRKPIEASVDTSEEDVDTSAKLEEDAQSSLVVADVADPGVATNGLVTLGQQNARNALAAIECNLSAVSDNDFVNHSGVYYLISRFSLLDIATQVRLFLLVQARLAQIQAYTADKKTSLGEKFIEDFHKLKNAFTQCMVGEKWPRVGTNPNPSILGIREEDLFDAYVSDRSAIHGLLNLWRSYTTASEMSKSFFSDMFTVFTESVLPGKIYCLTANSFINHVLTDLQTLRQQINNGSMDENPQYSLDDVEENIAMLMKLKSYFSKIVTGASLTLLTGPELSKKLNSITTNLSIIERGCGFAVAAKDKNYFLGLRLAVVADIQDVILRGRAVGDQLRDIVTRILKLHDLVDVNKQEQAYGAFFMATVDLLFFLDAFSAQDATAARGLIRSEVKSIADRLRSQYELWNNALSNIPMLGAVEYVGAKRTKPVMDIYSASPTDYADHDGRLASVDRLIAFMPYVTTGSGQDAALGLRVYATSEAAEQPDLSNYFESPGKFNPAAWQNPQAYVPKTLQDVEGDEVLVVSPAPSPAPVSVNLGSMSLEDISKYSQELFANAMRWMTILKPRLPGGRVGDYALRDYAFAVSASWVRMGILLDEVLYVKDKKPTAYVVQAKWRPFIDLLKSYMSILSQKQTQRFISQILGDLAQTHAYDVLDATLKSDISEMFRKVSNRSKANPAFIPNLRLVDSLGVIERIELAFKKGGFAAKKGIGLMVKKAARAVANSAVEQQAINMQTAAAIASLTALFDPKQGVIANDLFPENPDKKYLLVDVMLKSDTDNASDVYARIRNLVQCVPVVRSVSDYDIQVLKQWDAFLEMFFKDESKLTTFYKKFSDIDLTTGIKDLESRRAKISKEIASRGDISSSALVRPLSFKIRSSEDLKISGAALNILFERTLRERSLKKPIVDFEALLGSQLGFTGVFLYNESFFHAKSYSLGKHSGDEIKAALVVLRALISLLQQDSFKQPNGIGFAVAAHLLVPLSYIADEFGDKMEDKDADEDVLAMTRLFYLALKLLRALIPDQSSILPDVFKRWNGCSQKPETVEDVLPVFDQKHPIIIAIINSRTPTGETISLPSFSGASAVAMGLPAADHNGLMPQTV
jgi:hypothetical protein